MISASICNSNTFSVSLDSGAILPRAYFASKLTNPSPNELLIKRIKLEYPSSPSDSVTESCQPLEQVLVVQKTSQSATSPLSGSSFEPLVVAMNYTFSESSSAAGGGGRGSVGGADGRLIDLYSTPLMNTSLSQVDPTAMSKLVLQFAKDCGKDQICFTQAQLSLSFQLSTS